MADKRSLDSGRQRQMDVTHQRPQDMDPTNPSPAKPFRAGSDEAGGTYSKLNLHNTSTNRETRSRLTRYSRQTAAIRQLARSRNLCSTTLARRTSNCTGAKGC
jgi:hypothetical protein